MAQRHIATAFEYAKTYAQGVMDANTGSPRTYWWLVDPKECTLVGGDRGRCIAYLWQESRFSEGLERTIDRVAVFAIWLEGTVYMQRTQQLDLFSFFNGEQPFHLICSDVRAGAARCT
jgi:hypothetical protein